MPKISLNAHQQASKLGLHIGDHLPAISISKWAMSTRSHNRICTKETRGWHQGLTSFFKDRKIDDFDILDGILAFKVSGTFGVYLRAEGFLEFKARLEGVDSRPTPEPGSFKVGDFVVYFKKLEDYSAAKEGEVYLIKGFSPIGIFPELEGLPKGKDEAFQDNLRLATKEDMKRYIPKYVKCIKGLGNNNFDVIGQIYPVKSYDPIEGILQIGNQGIYGIFFGVRSLLRYTVTDYVPVSKEEYEASKKTITKPKKIQTMSTTQTITKANLKQIRDIACRDWREKIDAAVKASDPYSSTIEVSDSDIRAGYEACDSIQKAIMEKYFKIEKEFNSSMMDIGQIMETSSGDLILRTYNGIVSLKDPSSTWTPISTIRGKLIPRGKVIGVVAG